MTPDTLRYPGQAWETLAAPEAVGWSGGLLSQAKAYAQSIGSLAVMVVTRGAALDSGRAFAIETGPGE